MKAGEPQNCLYFISKGLVKNYIETEYGESKIYNFRTERHAPLLGMPLYNYRK